MTQQAPVPQTEVAGIAARIDRIPTGPFHIRVASVLGTGTFFDGFDAISLGVVLTAVLATFQIGIGEAGVIIAAGYVGQFVGALAVGALSDRIGRRPTFILSLAVFGLFSLLCAFAWSETSLLVFRVLQGLGLGAEVPIAATLLNEYLSRRTRGKVFVLYETLFPWGLFFAPLVALASVSAFGPETGWRVLFAIGALPLLVAVWAWFALPESARWLAENARVAEAERIVDRMEAEARARGVVLAEPEPAAVGDRVRARLGELFAPGYRNRTVMLAILWFTNAFVVWGYATWLPTMYIQIGGLPTSLSLVLTVILGAAQLIFAYATAFAIERFGRRPLLLGGFAVSMVGGALGALVTGVVGIQTWPVLFATGVLLALGTTVPSVGLYLYTAELFPTRMRGWATSAGSGLGRSASIVSPFVLAFLLAGNGGAPAVFGLFAVLALVGLVAMALGGVETRGRALEELAR